MSIRSLWPVRGAHRPGGHAEVERTILGALGRATGDTLRGATRILAVAILHERPHTTSHTAEHIAGLFVEQYKASGWVPPTLRVLPGTPVAMRRRPDAARLDGRSSNAILAEMLGALAPDIDPATCVAIGFSGDNPALGHTFFGVLAQ